MEAAIRRSPARRSDASVDVSPRSEQSHSLASLSLVSPYRLRRSSRETFLDLEPKARAPELSPAIKPTTRRGPAPFELNAAGASAAEAEPPSTPATAEPPTPVAALDAIPESPVVRPVASSPRAATSARGSRVSVRESRKEAIATSKTLDFVSLASCDENMVQGYDKISHLEALKRKRDRSPNTRQSPLSARMAPQSECASSAGSSELHGLELKRSKRPTSKGPRHSQSSRGGRTSGGSPSSDSFCLDGMPHPPPGRRSQRSTGAYRSLASAGFALPPRLLGSALSLGQDSLRAQGRSRMGSTHGSMESFSSILAGHAATMATCSTPPGAPTAFEAHTLLVKCPAPKRGPAFAQAQQSQTALR